MATFLALTSTFIIGLFSLVGLLTLSLKKELLQSLVFYLVSFATGALLGDVFFHLLPEATEKLGESAMIYTLGGLLVFFVVEKFIHWRHCHLDPNSHHHPLASMNLIGDGVHNFIDGLLIGASFLVSLPIGLSTAIAVAFHEIPQEIGDFAILVHSGFSRKKALFFNLLSAQAALLGTVVSLLIGSNLNNYAALLLPITAGGFLYIAGADLIPELHHECRPQKSFFQLLALLAGLGAMFALTFLEN